VLHHRGVLDDVEREARLSESRAARDEDEVGALEAAGLLVERLKPRPNPESKIATGIDLLGVAAEGDLERDDVAMERRLADGEEQLLRVGNGRRAVLAREGEARDLVRGADETTQERGALDDRRVGLGVRDRRHVLDETDEELRAADRVELVFGQKLGLHAREADLLAPLGDARDRREDEAMLFSREVGRREPAARDLVVDRAVHEHRAQERGFGLGFLGRRLDAALDR